MGRSQTVRESGSHSTSGSYSQAVGPSTKQLGNHDVSISKSAGQAIRQQPSVQATGQSGSPPIMQPLSQPVKQAVRLLFSQNLASSKAVRHVAEQSDCRAIQHAISQGRSPSDTRTGKHPCIRTSTAMSSSHKARQAFSQSISHSGRQVPKRPACHSGMQSCNLSARQSAGQSSGQSVKKPH